MSNEIKWIKVSTSLFDDEKIKQIRSMPGGDTMILVWLQLLLLAGRVNHDGLLVLSNTEIPYTEEMMATQFDVELKTVLLAIETFKRFGMVEIIDDIYHITNWAKHQATEGMEKIREQNRERKKAERERRKALEPAAAAPALPAASEEKTPMQRRFDRFWKAYPKKVGKGAAEKSFAKYKPDDALTDTMIRSVEAHKHTTQWQRDGGQYIPNPATWLNQRRWEDEVQQPIIQRQPLPAARGLEEWD